MIFVLTRQERDSFYFTLPSYFTVLFYVFFWYFGVEWRWKKLQRFSRPSRIFFPTAKCVLVDVNHQRFSRPSRIFLQRPNVFLVDVNHLFLWQFKCVFGGCQSSVSMSIQERALSKFSAEWNNKKILREVLTTLWVCISNLQQNLADLKSTKTNRSAKVLFIESSMASKMHSKHLKIAMQTCFNESKLRRQICTKLTFILFEEVLKSTELLLWVRSQSANVWF